MAKVIITELLEKDINKIFKKESIEIFSLLRTLEDSPHKGKAVGVVGKILIKELKYNKFYIGLARQGNPTNFAIFRPKKTFLRLEPRLAKTDEKQDQLESAGLNVMDYDDRWGRYRLRLTSADIEKQPQVLTELLEEAYRSAGN